MPQTGWSRQALIRYSLIQLPGMLLVGLVLIVIHSRFHLPAWAGWLIFVLWVLKDGILFFFLWPAYDNQSRDVYSLVGHTGVAASDLNPKGRVRLHGQTWPARTLDGSGPIPVGTRVRVVDRQGLLLRVRREHIQRP